MKKLDTAKRLIKRFKEDLKEFSFKVALGRFVLDFPIGSWEKRNRFYMRQVYNYLDMQYSHVVKQCMENHDDSKCVKCEKKRIWVMWWQGENEMLPIVKACYIRLLKAAGDCEVILITKDNYLNYISIPEHILSKVNSGEITLTHLSDIIRVTLLRDYGGAWFDATIYAEAIPNEIFQNDFYTLHAPGLFPYFINNGNWAPFFLCTSKKSTMLFECMCELFFAYWQKQCILIDYLLVDCFIKIVKSVDPYTKELIKDCPENRDYYNLNLSINEQYETAKFEEMMSKSPLQKLSYKKELHETDENGNSTFYSYILTREQA